MSLRREATEYKGQKTKREEEGARFKWGEG